MAQKRRQKRGWLVNQIVHENFKNNEEGLMNEEREVWFHSTLSLLYEQCKYLEPCKLQSYQNLTEWYFQREELSKAHIAIKYFREPTSAYAR